MSRNKRVQCDRPGCEEWFNKKTHNQRYHDDECTRLATNARIMRNYYENRERTQGKVRLCRLCEVTQLSRYNESTMCAACKSKRQTDANAEIVALFNKASLIA